MKSFCIIFYLLAYNWGVPAQSQFAQQDAELIVDAFFEGFHEGDTLKMRQVMSKNIVMQTAFKNKNGEHIVDTTNVIDFLSSIANRPEEQQWDERLLDYRVQIDGNLAHVWTPYQFYFNGNFSHCGANAFTLTKTNEGWKIQHLIDSRRREGCLND
ncbi:MAG: nuclear transport factor 2 family protein [Patiriisocius sp.]|uniref:nuclear transport factor 2 family protein n=1 Tax=Patiriisocius sp. TaxID=2822396 RepID=UPI003EF3C202